MTKLTAPLSKFVGVLLVLLTLGCIAASIKHHIDALRTERDEANRKVGVAQTQVTTMLDINRANGDAFKVLAAQREIDTKIMLHLNAQFTTIAAQYEQQKQSVAKLEKENAEVRKYLDTAVPAELRGLLNNKPGSKTSH